MKKVLKLVSLVMAISIVLSAAFTVSAKTVVKPKKITLKYSSVNLYVGQNKQLDVKSVSPKNASKSVKWQSSNKSVVTVSSKGKIKAIKNGTATVTAISKYNSKVKAKCKVVVKTYKNTKPKFKNRIISTELDGVMRNSYYNAQKITSQTKESKTVFIESYEDLKEYKTFVKKNYLNNSQILKQLNKYGKSYFKTRSLVCNNAAFWDHSNRYEYSVDYVETKVSVVNGKITAVINVNKRSLMLPDHEYTTDCSFYYKTTFVSFDKKDIKKVQSYKVKFIKV